MRTPLICANWKMHKTLDEARAFVEGFAAAEQPSGAADIVIFPPFPYLLPVAEAIAARGLKVAVGAQCCHQEPEGAYTGAVSCEMVASVGASYALCGHSERRRVFGEPDEDINAQVQAALQTGLVPVLCVGETLEERERDRTHAVITHQLTLGLLGLSTRSLGPGLAIAYEPVWAIGTGRTATAAQAQQVHAFIRSTLAQRFDDAVAARTPILYGGSVKPGNTAEIMAEADVDGVLVGGASLEADGFAAIARAAAG